MYKQVILIRMDLKLSKGKAIAQGSHASVETVLKSGKEKIKAWKEEGMKKVILKVKDEKELLRYKREADKFGLVTALIKDAGRTEIEAGTVTCLGIGPDNEDKMDKITGKLKML